MKKKYVYNKLRDFPPEFSTGKLRTNIKILSIEKVLGTLFSG
jgi:hypothetical protein